jgi:hypothetical protein
VDILSQLVEERHTSFASFAAKIFVAAIGAGEIEIAEAAPGLVERVRIGPAGATELVRHLVQVKLELVVDVSSDLPARAPGKLKETPLLLRCAI